jgi:folate-dependent phosphoribosylglycinamide formyltransferase PurN
MDDPVPTTTQTDDPVDGEPSRPARVVLLAGPGDTTDIVANYLSDLLAAPTRTLGPPARLDVIVEESPSRSRMARRRARRVGWTTVVGQVLLVVLVLPGLRRRGRRRIDDIVAGAGLSTAAVAGTHRVTSVNDPATVDLIRSLDPTVVVVNGTRIIAGTVLDAISCPVINTHAGITPRYRGVHGGYWALAEGRRDLVGTTVHLVDPGIDTGGVLARAYFAPGPHDTIATLPYLHLAAGLPLLGAEVTAVLDGKKPSPLVEDVPPGGSRLYLHPTVWGYAYRRLVRRVR